MANFKPSLDTLAQLGKISSDREKEGLSFELENTTTREDKETLKKRARAKTFAQAIAVGLVSASEQSDGILLKQYWNSYHCASIASLHSDGKVSSKYCKTRWCLVCSRIRTAKLIKQYLPHIKEWAQTDRLNLVTLTDVNVPGDQLQPEIVRLKNEFRKIAETLKKRARKRQCEPLFAIVKIECTYNPKADTYNPHLHILVKGNENAGTIKNEWLKRSSTASPKAQSIEQVRNEKGLLEVFKYAAKMIVSEPGKKGIRRSVEMSSLHVIFSAFQGLRTLQPYGFRCSSIASELSSEERTKAEVLKEYEWNKYLSDWVSSEINVNEQTGELLGITQEALSGYEPGKPFLEFLNKGILLNGSPISEAKEPEQMDILKTYPIKPIKGNENPFKLE